MVAGQMLFRRKKKIDSARLAACLAQVKQYVDEVEDSYSIDGLSDSEISMHLAIAIDMIGDEETPDLDYLKLLFAPTGPIQEIAIDAGWGDEFLHHASEFDAATNRKS